MIRINGVEDLHMSKANLIRSRLPFCLLQPDILQTSRQSLIGISQIMLVVPWDGC